MSCKKVAYETLMRLHDGELRGLRAIALRRHVQHCTACAQVLAELGSVDMLLKRADSFLPEPKPARRALRPLGLVGGLALAVGAVVFFAMPGSVVRPTPSFAAVEDALSQIQTVHWDETHERETVMQVGAEKRKSRQTTLTEGWAEPKGERLVTRIRKGKPVLGGLYLFDKQNLWWYHPAEPGFRRNYVHFPAGAFGERPIAQMIREQILFSTEEPTQKDKRAIAYSPWKQTEETLKGRKTLKFSRTGINQGKAGAFRHETLVWVDPTTMHLLRREQVDQGSGKTMQSRSRTVAENFRYNETPPPGTFDLPIPKVGEPYHYLDLEQATADKPANDKALRELGQKALAAYQKRDASAFLALWDWEAVPEGQRVARQKQWGDAVARQSPYKTWRYGAMTTGLSAVHTFVRKTEADPFPPLVPGTVDATLGSWVTTATRAKPALVAATFTFTKRSGQWKIQQLQLSTEPLPKRWLKGKH